MTPKQQSIVRQIQAYIEQYVTFSTPAYSFVAALWVLATYLWPHFDAFPYLVISSPVKRSGKTRFAEVLEFITRGMQRFTAATVASVYAFIRDGYLKDEVTGELVPKGGAIVGIDEAETLSTESANDIRAMLNAGYRRGTTIPRWSKNGLIEWPVYSPKVFILIGDVFDTLRDRSIVVEMWRAEPQRRFVYPEAKAEGRRLADEIGEAAAMLGQAVVEHYRQDKGLTFLEDRDEEIWLPLFAVASVFCADRIEELQRVAVDLATLKTQEKKTYRELAGAEVKADQDSYATRLLNDLALVSKTTRTIFTEDAIERLKAIPTAPWRTFRGEGITAYSMADLLKPMGIAPRLLKVNGKARRGYRVADFVAVLSGKRSSSRTATQARRPRG